MSMLTNDMIINQISQIFESFSDIQSKTSNSIHSCVQTLRDSLNIKERWSVWIAYYGDSLVTSRLVETVKVKLDQFFNNNF